MRFESAPGKVVSLAELEKGQDFTLLVLSTEAAQTPVPEWAIEREIGDTQNNAGPTDWI
jgi:hypothetical protein